ncbi:XylR family transcriptional regulator [Pontiellaceae bacterium B12227]|nr:XylR family transcriptional regulator [Pontiellaceae bacterium B12227]
MMKSNKTPEVAILIGTARTWGRDLVKGILTYTNQVTPWHVWVRPNIGGFYDALPEGWHGDGVIARVTSPKLAEELNASGIPVVDVSDTPLPGFSAPCVRTDDNASTRMAAEHFIKRGFKNMAVLNADSRQIQNSYANTFKKTVEEQGLTCSTFTVKQDQSDLNEELARWLTGLPKPVGIVSLGLQFGSAIVECCKKIGLNVPHDVAVLCSNYDELMNYACHPPLSGIVSPTKQIGFKVAELLQQMMTGEQVPHENIFIPPTGIREHLSTDTIAVEDPKLVPLVEFLQENAFKAITMNDILKIIPMSRRTLERRYFKAFGRTPFDEIKLIRINHARKLLVETDWPLQIIAEECGYSTYNYLAQVFKQVTGISPSSYRKKMTLS